MNKTNLIRLNSIKNQLEFCNILMKNLNDEIFDELNKRKYENEDVYWITNYTRMTNDITKLRIELNKLSKQLSTNSRF